MLLDTSRDAFPHYALQGSGLNVACSLADELDTKLLALLLVVKQTRLPDNLYNYKRQLYNWAHHVRNKLHSIPLHALHAGMTPALNTFCSIYDECQAFRIEICNDAVSSTFPDIKMAVRGLALTPVSESSVTRIVDQTKSGGQMWIQAQGGEGHIHRPTATKKADQVLLDAVEKVQRLQQTPLPSPSSSQMVGGFKDDEANTNVQSTFKGTRGYMETGLDIEPTRPIPEPITPSELLG